MKITHNGKSLSVIDWSTLTGIPAQTIRCRLYAGWDPGVAVTRSPKDRRGIPNHAKLDQKKAERIRYLLKLGHRPKDVAEFYGLGLSTVQGIGAGIYWKDQPKGRK